MARTTTLLFTGGDYAARLVQLEQRLEELADAPESTSARRLSSGGEFSEVEAEWKSLRAEAEENGTRLVLRGLDDFEAEEFETEFPPRDGEDGDKTLGFDAKKGRRELVRRCAVEPKFGSASEFAAWLRERELTRGDVEKAFSRAWFLTYGQQPDPKSPADLPRRGGGEISG